jgi:hypothetical protein
MKYSKKYEALRIDDNKPIGPLRIPIVPPGVDPNDILNIIIDKKRREKDDRYQPHLPPKGPEQLQ